MVRVKICGITNLGDALLAVENGADALGFVFYDKSPRKVTAKVVAQIVEELPPFVSKVGVFVDSSLEEVAQIMAFCRLDLAQLHGEECPAYCEALHPRVIKAFRVRERWTLDRMNDYRAVAYLLDAYNPGKAGGTGETFDWEIARTIGVKARVILAGGLTPTNVRQAIELVRPYGVDVSTGVEISPGKKDAGLVRAFIRAAKGVDK